MFTVKSDANLMGRLKDRASRDAATYVLFSNVLMTIFDAYGAYLWNTRYRSRPLFLIYSGGDDIVVVGDYNALDYITNIVRRANEFSINVATGALLHDVHYPIYLAWSESEERLEGAKQDRSRSLMYVMSIDGAPVILEPGDISGVVSYVSRKLMAEETWESMSLLHRLYGHFVNIYRALYGVAVSRGDSECMVARRRLVRALIEYTYYFNRNSERLEEVVTEFGRELLPQGLARLLLSVRCGDAAGAGQYLRQLGRAIVSINIRVLTSKTTTQ